MQTTALVLIGLGLKITFDYTDQGNSPNLASLHSWTGIFTVSLFMANYSAGILIFANPWVGGETKKTFVPIHQFLGLFTFVLACFQVMTGIQEENVWSGACQYSVSAADYGPAFYYQKIAKGCRVSNGLGICVFVLALTTVYAVTDLRIGNPRVRKVRDGTFSALLVDSPFGSNGESESAL